MNEIKSVNIELIECPDCKNYANRTLKDKIKDGGLYLRQNIEYFKSCMSSPYFIKIVMMKRELWAESGKACVKKYEKIDCPDEEHAIIVIHHKEPSKSRYKNDYVYGSGIDLLVNYFNKKSIKFKIYHCHEPECFYKSIKESKAQNLWVFGHGDRHGIYFWGGKGGYCPFCKIVGTNRRTFIGQLHCCSGTGRTLWEYLSNKPGIFSEGFRSTVQNRDDIEKWIEQNRV